MKLVACAIYDSVAKAFLPPFFVHNSVIAQRAVSDVANDDSHAIGKNPADYTLFRLGEFDDDTGLLKPLQPAENLGNAASFVREIHDVRDQNAQASGAKAHVLTRAAGGNSA